MTQLRKLPSDTTVYIAGPMTGYPNLNQDTFRRVARLVQGVGYTAIVPHDIEAYPHTGDCPVAYSDHPGQARTAEHAATCYLRADLRAMLTCDIVLLLDNWHASVGARLEHEAAVTCGIPTVSESFFISQIRASTA